MGIGALRFVLSLLVIDAHYGFLQPRIQMAVVERFGLANLAFVGSGGIAVSGFFVVSGYLIALVLDRKYERGWHGARAFYVSRALRIYPLYWLVFGAYWAALVAAQAQPQLDAARVLGNLSLIPYGVWGLAGDRNADGVTSLTETMVIGPAWTLTYDLVFYLLAPWLFRTRRTTWWIFGLGLAYFTCYIALADPRPPIWYQFFYEAGVPYLFMFAGGALAFHYRDKLHLRTPALLGLAAALAWIVYFPLGLPNTFANHLLAALLFVPLVGALGQRRHVPRVDRVLGDLTYATYLLHVPLLVLAHRLGWPAPALLALALTYAGGFLLLWTFELPLDKLRDRLYLRSRQRPADGAPSRVAMPAAVALTAVLAAAAGIALYANLWRAGDVVALVAAACPGGWQCEGGRMTVAGEGAVALEPALPKAKRIVADLDVRPGAGNLWAGFASLDGAVRVGIRRSGGTCRLEIADRDGVRRDPPGWGGACRKHRFAFDQATGRLRVVVDSLWVLTASTGADGLRATVDAPSGGTGEAAFTDVFVTRR